MSGQQSPDNPIALAPLSSPLNGDEQQIAETSSNRQNDQSNAQSEGVLVPALDKSSDSPYTLLGEKEKIFIIIVASFSAFISPVSGSAYFPALDVLSSDLKVSISAINLTITVYMVFQGVAPTFIGTFSDQNGRRPAFFVCYIIYIGANIGLALQNSYPALMVLRCLQSSGSSGTIALASATAADIVTRAERGKYLGYASMGVTLGPALGPIIGGLLTQFLGWRAIFWFLTIYASVLLLILLVWFPETCRSVVGNGSVPPQRWNRSLVSVLLEKRRSKSVSEDRSTIIRRKRRPNPLEALLLAFERENAIILVCGALLYAGFFGILSSLPSQLQDKYGYNSLQVGLCYIPYGIGSLTSRWTAGLLLDRNFHRHAKLLGIEIVKNRQQRLIDFPIEVARLQVTLPLIYIASVSILIYGWVMEYKTNLAGPVITLFLTGHATTGAISSLSTLLVDCNVESPATATAAFNLFRCLFGAGATAAIVPIINRIGMGWTGTVVALIWLVFSPMLWIIMKKGHAWRQLNAKKKAAENIELARGPSKQK